MQSTVKKRSVLLKGHKTSVSLEGSFWIALKEIAGETGTSVGQLVSRIDGSRGDHNLSSAVRLFVLAHYRSMANPHATGAGSAASTVRAAV